MLFQKWWLIRSLLKYGSPLLSAMEKPAVERLGADPPEDPVVFIIGPPRSGSTILYQVLTSLLDVGYIDNLANLARYNPYSGLRMSQRRFPATSHRSYSSNYGRTTGGGLHAPAEALYFYKWFPKDRHYTEPADLDEAQKSEFRKTTYALAKLAGKPFVLKNLSFSLRLKVLRDVLPGARFIVVRRNPLFTTQSLLLAMRKTGQPMDRAWGILPKDFEQLEGLEPHELVVRQVNLIEKQIHEDLEGLPEEQVLVVDYEKLGTAPELVIGEISTLCGPRTNRRANVPLPSIEIRNQIQLPEEEIDLLKSFIQPLHWDLQIN